MIKVKKITPQTVEHFDSDDKSLGFLNDIESTYLRVQIAKENLSGYYLMFNNQKCLINNYGSIQPWENGLFDEIEQLLVELFKIRKKRREGGD